jgi:hypothetical protein
VLACKLCPTFGRRLTDFGEEFVDATGHEGAEQPSPSGSKIHPSMHGVARHNNRGSGPDLKLFARAVKAKPAFKDFKDFFPIFVIVEWWA